MPTFRIGSVTAIVEERQGLQRVTVEMEADDEGVLSPGGRAYALTDHVGAVAVGDRVVLNTTAVELGLGTGGWHVVHWNLSRSEWVHPGEDHVMKLRYTSLQSDVGTSELLHPDLEGALDLTPVVATLVHSQVGIVAAMLGAIRPGTRVAYVMTDGAALPAVLSDLVDDLRGRSLVDLVVSTGHAFGGDLEAVTVASGLALAVEVAGAEVVIVGMGPGVVGTGTRLGTTAIEAAAVLDTAARLGAAPVLAVRASSGDERTRHRGISHHTRTVAELTSSQPWVGAHPVEVAELAGVRVAASDVTGASAIGDVLDDLGLRITTMGRDHGADRLFFESAAAAAIVAADLLGDS